MCSRGSQRLSAIRGNTCPMPFRGRYCVENRDRRPIEEVYTIKQVVEMSGVPDNTIRSWERRFGMPKPLRSGTNQRRYTAANVGVIRAIQASRARGRTMEQSIQEVMSAPTLLAHAQVTPECARDPPEPEWRTGALSRRMFDLLISLDGAASQSLLADAIWSTTLEDACLDPLLKAADLVIRRRAEGCITSVQATYALEWIARKLHAAFDASQPEHGRSSVVVAGMHDTLASSRCLWLSIVLSRADYRVICLDREVTHDDIRELVERTDPAAIVLVVGSELAEVSAMAAYEHLATVRESGHWRGSTLASSTDARQVGAVPMWPIDPSSALKHFERALGAKASALRVMKSE